MAYTTKEEYTEEVVKVLREKGYGPHLDMYHINLIVSLVGNIEEFDQDPTPNELAWMYEVLGWNKYNK